MSAKQLTQFSHTPLDGVEAVFADLDGVVYRGSGAIDHAVDQLNFVQQHLPVGFITNNASRTALAVAEQLNGFGMHVRESDVITSPMAAADLLKTLLPAESVVFIVGSDALAEQVQNAGFRVTRDRSDNPVAVVQGFHPTVNWQHLADASYIVQNGATWVATNSDWTMPTAEGIAPGNGTLVSAVHTAAGPLATVAGKPEPAIFHTALESFNVKSALMLGDRLDTDIMGAKAAGLKSALIMTGIDGFRQLMAAGPEQQPDYILANLSELTRAYPVAHRLEHQGHPVVQVGKAAVALIDDVHVEVAAVDPDDPLNLLRAACTTIWETGRAIYGFYISEEILTLENLKF